MSSLPSACKMARKMVRELEFVDQELPYPDRGEREEYCHHGGAKCCSLSTDLRRAHSLLLAQQNYDPSTQTAKF